MKIAMITGSRRSRSFNGQLQALAKAALALKASVVEVDWQDVPFFDQDGEFPTPDSVKRVRDVLRDCDGVWFFTPEYNGQLPGAEKNLLDWLSRSETAGQRGTMLSGKAAAISSAGGRAAGKGAAAQLQSLLEFLGMRVMPEMTNISLSAQSWRSDDLGDTPGVMEKIDNQADSFVKWIKG